MSQKLLHPSWSANKSRLLIPSETYKPFFYPWAFEAWNQQQSIIWLPQEIPMSDDVRDWQYNITDEERNLLVQCFRFFTQADVGVNSCYTDYYLKIFGPTEIRMMLCAFANMETIHMGAYAYLLDTVGMPEVEYQTFLQYKEMSEKWELIQNFYDESLEGIAASLAMYGAFVEGLQLFASFAMLMNFPRFNKMKGMGQVVTWSVRDETLHTHSIIKMFRTFVTENNFLWTKKLQDRIISACEEVVRLEDNFIELAFEQGGVQGLEAQDIKNYIRYIGDRRLTQLGLKPVFGIAKNPLPWMDSILNGLEHANFFEGRATEYTKASSTGSWDEVFDV
ncbi:MAG: ribonucleotide-diphosphate reductase subunit beta [Alphaproteobacteria bacterium]|nr:ribonucleotide-diphosphate reductase subunit beta [Alphaproteobacteria bacterium]